ncbi:MAG TPA: class I SAM-dependent methyltransferase, partial [Flavisolibacter sp.]|nr:class I SAM-dependent methyltransferase [Flavisolibacter sp.]
MASVTAFTGNVPHNYETYLGPLFFEPYAVDLADRLPNQAFNQILELACGTGRVTKHLLAKLKPTGQLIATDLNEAMLTVGREKVPDDRIKWQAVDAHNLPYDEETFDLIVCQYGVMFFADKPKAFREAVRVLRPGGTFLFNTWDHIRYNTLSNTAREVMDEMFPDDPPTFLSQGPYSFFDKEQIQHLLDRAGFVDITIETVSLTGIASSADDC